MTGMYGWFEETGYGSNLIADAEAYSIEPNDLTSFLSNDDAVQSLPPVGA